MAAQKRILLVFGTRPEAIKMVPVITALKHKTNQFIVKVCVTAQHRKMLDQVLDFFSVVPDYDLNLMQANQSLNQITSRVLTEIKPVFEDYKPHCVLVHGDTTTSMASSLAAFYERVPVGHIEAGLRSFNKYSPFPEELNRSITTRIATWHFAPTNWARENLRRELVRDEDILVTGNTVIDALLMGLLKLNDRSSGYGILEIVNKASRLILVTAHRRENFGAGFESMCAALLQIAALPNVQIVLPVHPNPNVLEVVNRMLAGVSNIVLIEPQPYEEFIRLMQASHIILTDSGGIQEEAPSLGKPVLVMRESTERPEGIDAGVVKLVGTATASIVDEVRKLLTDPDYYSQMTQKPNPFGDGHAAGRIAEYLTKVV